MRNRSRGFSLIFTLASTIIVLAIIVTFAWYFLIGSVVMNVVKSPSDTGETIGKWVGDFQKGLNEGSK